jgi:anti-sigma regulatory factor (Ser/Thr protein kinase)
MGQIDRVEDSENGALRLELRSDVDAPTVARRFVGEIARDLPPDLAGDAELLVSELVSNAVRHGRPEITLRVSLDPPLIGVSVHDEGAALPSTAVERADLSEPSGRGLFLVDRMSSDWGITPSDPPPGKTVWFRLDPRDA